MTDLGNNKYNVLCAVFGGLFVGWRGWVGVRKVMEEISKDQIIKEFICSALELNIFPEGSVCVCYYVCTF